MYKEDFKNKVYNIFTCISTALYGKTGGTSASHHVINHSLSTSSLLKGFENKAQL